MAIHNNQVSVTYTDAELRKLVEEYITQQKSEFTLKGVCSCIFYWAVEDRKVAEHKSLIKSEELNSKAQERVIKVLNAIIEDGRVADRGRGVYHKH